jgi:hypothetical protein
MWAWAPKFIHTPGNVSWMTRAMLVFPERCTPFRTTIWPAVSVRAEVMFFARRSGLRPRARRVTRHNNHIRPRFQPTQPLERRPRLSRDACATTSATVSPNAAAHRRQLQHGVSQRHEGHTEVDGRDARRAARVAATFCSSGFVESSRITASSSGAYVSKVRSMNSQVSNH